jgi:hypothetical protein
LVVNGRITDQLAASDGDSYSGLPRIAGLAAQDAMDAGGGQVGGGVEGVVAGAVAGKETLRRSGRSKTLHLPLSSSDQDV